MVMMDFLRKMFGHDSSTRAASVQLWVVIPALLLLMKFAASSMGPRFALTRQISPGIGLLHVLSYYSVSYTLGLMKPDPASAKNSAPTANAFFQIWAVLITTMQDSARIGRPYKPKEMTMVDLLNSLWSANQLRAHAPLYLKVPLWVIWSIHASRIIWFYVSSNRAAGASEGNMKLVSDYMASSQHTADGASPETMEGYRYFVLGEDQLEKVIERPGFRLRLDLHTRPEDLVTLEKVWGHRPDIDGTLLSDKLLGTDGDSKFKDVCLSFALYKLLRRRFYDFPMPEAKHPASGRLVSHGILNENDYERVFRVTEVELSFLQDFSYSKHAVVFARGFPTHRVTLSLLMTAAALYLAYAVRDVPSTSMARTSDGRVTVITHGVAVTHCLIAIVAARELWEVGVYVLSQWTKVLIVCHYVRLQQRRGLISTVQRLVMDKVARIMFWLVRRGRWDQKIQQYNLLMAARDTVPNTRLRIRLVKLPIDVKTKIFESLRLLIISTSLGEEENDLSESVGRRNNDALRSYLRKAFADNGGGPPPPFIDDIHSRLEGETHKILVWHVATSICQINLLAKAGRTDDDLYALPTASNQDPQDIGLEHVWPHYVAAVAVSNYCVHLVSEALLPDNGLVADTVLGAVRDEARDILRGCHTRTKMYNRLVVEAWAPDESSDGPSIVKIGAQLAVHLESRYDDGRDAELWACMGKFWVGFLLHLSASTRAAKHQIYLQGRAELTTHLWALLSHAGFLGETTHGEQLLDPVDLSAA